MQLAGDESRRLSTPKLSAGIAHLEKLLKTLDAFSHFLNVKLERSTIKQQC